MPNPTFQVLVDSATKKITFQINCFCIENKTTTLLRKYLFDKLLGSTVKLGARIAEKKTIKVASAMSSPLEDKKCRLCGYTDQKNVNMFNAPNKGLITKIRSVFPILLYEHDPLPKHICKKCIATVSFMHLDIQRVMKMQEKWIKNVRCIEPNNNYICILDMIETSNRGVKQSIQTILQEDIPLESVERISLSFPIIEQTPKRKYMCDKKEEPLPTTTTLINHLNVPLRIKEEPKDTKDPLVNGEKLEAPLPYQTKRAAAVAAAVACTTQLLYREPKTRKSDLISHTKKETKKIKPISTNCTVVRQKLVSSPTIQTGNIKCPLCELRFKNNVELAAHQVLHLRLQLPKIFERKCLPKKDRRGRLLNLNDKQCIRCLNCWRVFDDNQSILSHWSQSDCGFYCQICGKEFAHAPKMLREHVPAAHGVSYRSTKMQHAKYAPPIVEPTTYKVETNTDFLTSLKTRQYLQDKLRIKKVKKSNPKERAACSICHLWFHNVAARNSHMRKHKKKISLILKDVKQEREVANEVEPKLELEDISENSMCNNTEVESILPEEIPMTSIKSEPFDIDDLLTQVRCQICNNILTDSLDQHACF